MNKLFTKIGTAMVGIAMAIGVGVAVGRDQTKEVKAAEAQTGETVLDYASIYNGSGPWSAQGTSVTISASSGAHVGNNTKGNGNYYGMIAGTALSSSSTFAIDTTKRMVVSVEAGYYGGSGLKLSTRFSWSGGYQDVEGDGITVNKTGTFYDMTLPANTAAAKDVSISITSDCTGTAVATQGQKTVRVWSAKVYFTDAPTATPNVTLDKTSLSLNVGGSSSTIEATPNSYLTNPSYTWSIKDGSDDCITLSNTDTSIVTVAPKGTAVKATATIALSVTGDNDANVSKEIPVTVTKISSEASPYSVADARSAIDNGVGMTDAYVKGIVSSIETEYSSQYGNISYNISDDGKTTSDQFLVYRGKGYDGEVFVSADDIQVGDLVIIKGNLKKYNDIYETNATNTEWAQLIYNDHDIGKFADDFLNAMRANGICGTTEERHNDNNKTAVSAIWATWKGKFEALHADAKALFVENSSDADIVASVKLYKHCVSRYELDAWTDAPSIGSGLATSPINSNSIQTSSALIIAVVAAFGLAAIGGLLFVRRRKEDR